LGLTHLRIPLGSHLIASDFELLPRPVAAPKSALEQHALGHIHLESRATGMAFTRDDIVALPRAA
jgi:hypothetical protein